MSLVCEDHISPAKSRHGAHYHLVARKHDGKQVLGMSMYPTEMEKRLCSCGKWIYDDLECMYCGRDISSVIPVKVKAHY